MPRAKVTIDFASHYKEWSEFRKSPEVEDWIGAAADAAAAEATARAQVLIGNMRRPGEALQDPQFRSEVTHGSKRCRGHVWTANYGAKFAQARWKVLQDAIPSAHAAAEGWSDHGLTNGYYGSATAAGLHGFGRR